MPQRGLYSIDHLSQDGEDRGRRRARAQACAAADESAAGQDRTPPARKNAAPGIATASEPKPWARRAFAFIDRVINFVQTARGRLRHDG
jgi:hypothetical protein